MYIIYIGIYISGDNVKKKNQSNLKIPMVECKTENPKEANLDRYVSLLQGQS